MERSGGSWQQSISTAFLNRRLSRAEVTTGNRDMQMKTWRAAQMQTDKQGNSADTVLFVSSPYRLRTVVRFGVFLIFGILFFFVIF